ncbi:MAG: YihY family inner membrane protein [Gammaproteobacteria bacterium]|nr:YihY family inner membrane protein [Gammaproteobacteria bacterium]
MLKPQQLKERVANTLWSVDLAGLTAWERLLVRAMRIAYVVVRDLADGQLTLRAMSLVYTTLLSLVPLLAVSFSVLKAFGVHNQVEPLLLNLLAPLGEKGLEITRRIIEFVDNVKAGLLGSLGLALLIYTVVSLIQKVERAFNFTWHVTHDRPISQRFSDYLSVIVIGPVLVFSALGITASVMSTSVVRTLSAIQPFGGLLEFGGRLVPYLLVIAAFAFVYVFVPNTRVRARSALMGAVVAGVLWETTGWAFASFIAGSARYTVIYSTFAGLILFMIWLYLNWLILLVGASIAFYHQHPEYVARHRIELQLSNRLKERFAVMLMALVAQAYQHRRAPWTTEGLARRLSLPLEAIESLIQTLIRRGLLARTDTEPRAYLPAHPPERIPLTEVLSAIRSAEESAEFNVEHLVRDPRIDRLFLDLERAHEDALRGRTLRDLAEGDVHPAAVGSGKDTSERV